LTKSITISLFKKPIIQVTLARVLLVLLTASLFVFPACSETHRTPAELLRAAIIDQLYSIQPNKAFIRETTDVLGACGFEVDLYQGDEVNVDFYRQLPGCGYKLIIFRAHSGLLGSKGKIVKRTCLFTNEPYSESKHISEQLSDQLAMARIDEHHPWVFGIGSEFVTQNMKGEFDNALIIMMGCSCIYLPDLAEAFVEKGASAYLAWDASVSLDYVDKATLYLIKQLCVEKVTTKKAVTSTMNVVGPDPKYKAVLKYFPQSSGDETLEQLIG